VADPQGPKKPSKIPTVLWGAITAGLLFRTFWRPSRAVVQKGVAAACPGISPPGSGCSTVMLIQGTPNATQVYAVTSGIVAIAADGSVQIASDREPVIIGYGPNPAQVFVQTGQKVQLGQEIAVMDNVAFSVTELIPDGKGGVTFQSIEPASWLAARGLRVAQAENVPTSLWCSHGRSITVPTATLGCGIKLPEPSALMLLPVTVTTE
jgi:hypothetical protein